MVRGQQTPRACAPGQSPLDCPFSLAPSCSQFLWYWIRKTGCRQRQCCCSAFKEGKSSFTAERAPEKPEICHYLHRSSDTNVLLKYCKLCPACSTSSIQGSWAAVSMRKCCLPLPQGDLFPLIQNVSVFLYLLPVLFFQVCSSRGAIWALIPQKCVNVILCITEF